MFPVGLVGNSLFHDFLGRARMRFGEMLCRNIYQVEASVRSLLVTCRIMEKLLWYVVKFLERAARSHRMR